MYCPACFGFEALVQWCGDNAEPCCKKQLLSSLGPLTGVWACQCAREWVRVRTCVHVPRELGVNWLGVKDALLKQQHKTLEIFSAITSEKHFWINMLLWCNKLDYSGYQSLFNEWETLLNTVFSRETTCIRVVRQPLLWCRMFLCLLVFTAFSYMLVDRCDMENVSSCFWNLLE